MGLLSFHGAESESKWLNVDLGLGPRLDLCLSLGRCPLSSPCRSGLRAAVQPKGRETIPRPPQGSTPPQARDPPQSSDTVLQPVFTCSRCSLAAGVRLQPVFTGSRFLQRVRAKLLEADG